LKKQVVVFAIVTLLLSGLEIACAHYLAASDAIALVIALKPGAIVAAIVALSARLCRYLILPGWALSLAVSWVWTRVQAKRAKAS
jgi:hypothetical protein